MFGSKVIKPKVKKPEPTKDIEKELKDQIKKLENDKKDLEAKIKVLESEITILKASESDLKEVISLLTKDIVFQFKVPQSGLYKLVLKKDETLLIKK